MRCRTIPTGSSSPGTVGGRSCAENMDGFRVSYVWVKTSPVKTTKYRLLLYATYALSSTLAGAVSRRPDVVFASSPPLPVAAAGAAVAWRHRVPWVIDVRDPWPEAAVALGELTNPRVIGYAERLERRLYRSAAAIVTVTEPFRQSIAAKVTDPQRRSAWCPTARPRFGSTPPGSRSSASPWGCRRIASSAPTPATSAWLRESARRSTRPGCSTTASSCRSSVTARCSAR